VNRENIKIVNLVIIIGSVFMTPLSMAKKPLGEVDTSTTEIITITKDRYLQDVATSATKTETPALETSQSIVTITRAQMDHQNSQTVSEALRYSSGVLSDVEATSRNDSVFLRGFGGFGTGTVLVSFLDGLKLARGQAFAQFSIDSFLLERVDIVKGPSAVLYGQISPGGLVNQITRKPTSEDENEVRVELGSYDRLQAGFASRGAIDDDEEFLYSLAAIGRTSGTRFDNVEDERVAIAPSLTWKPDSDTSLTINGFYSRDPQGGIFNSAPAKDLAPQIYQNALNSTLNFGDSGVESFEREQYGIGYQFDQQFSNFSLHSGLRYSNVDADFFGIQFIAPLTETGLLPRAAIHSNEIAEGIAADNRIQTDFITGNIAHNVIIGVDYQRNTADWEYNFGAATALDVINPIYNQSVGPFFTVIDNHQIQIQTGIYVQDQMEIDRFRFTLGLRHDQASLETKNYTTGISSKQSDDETSYKAGLLYLFDSGIAPYISYSTSFEPTIGVGEDGVSFKPTTARQFEGGIKYQSSDIPLLVTGSIFDIEQDNTLTASSTLGFSVQQGQIQSRGLELEARGSIVKNLELIVSATWLDTQVRKSSNQEIIGKRPQAVPKNFASIWASYHIPTGTLKGWDFGGGIRYVSDSYGDDLNKLRSPNYTITDLALRYDFGELSSSLSGTQFTFNVSNLFDKEYYTSCSFDIYCQFGNRRQVLIGFSHDW